MNAAEYISAAARDVEQALDGLLPLRQISPEAPLYQAMRYSLFAGGKRLRPALLLAAGEACGGGRQQLLPWAAALEMIHTYSLIHDDLPAMDNDDLRRGRPTCHKVYGEAMAILAGDGLLSAAFELMLRPLDGIDPARQLEAARLVAELAGISGMVAGQAAEFAAGDAETDVELITYIYRGKTSALLRAAVLSGSMLSGADQKWLDALSSYGHHLGLAFQLVDDVLDIRGDQQTLGKPIGSDAGRGLTTYARLVGCEQALELARQHGQAALDSLAPLGESAALLRQFVSLFIERAS